MKMKKLTYTVKDTGESDTIVADEDRMEIIVGQLMDQYWDPQGGWAITYKIVNAKNGDY